jgi:hypothetical protein
VPYDVAFSLSAEDRTAHVIAIGVLCGHVFDWQLFDWVDI